MDTGGDLESDEEEISVMVELGIVPEPDLLYQPGLVVQAVGLDSQKPLVQIGEYTFEGQYEDTVGTSVLFETNDEVDGERHWQISDKTQKRLRLQRVYLREKSAETDAGKDGKTESQGSSGKTASKHPKDVKVDSNS